MIRKAFAFILITAFAALALVACANGTQNDTNVSEETTDTEIDVMATDTVAITDEESESDTETEAVGTEDGLDSAYVYVALGDSIAYGYGLIDFDNERYSALIEEALSDKVEAFTDFNYAVNGDTSGNLIELIKSGGAPELCHADLITISIGANNVLGTSIAKLSEYHIYSTSVTDENLKSIRIPQIYDEMMTQNAAGIAQFALDIVTIIELIKEAAPDAEIIFQTIYNPYRKLDVTFDFIEHTLDLAKETDRLVTSLNDIIKSNASTLGYKVADVYSAFDALDNVVNADTFTGGAADFVTALIEADPHPNKNGHRVIADTIIPIIEIK